MTICFSILLVSVNLPELKTITIVIVTYIVNKCFTSVTRINSTITFLYIFILTKLVLIFILTKIIRIRIRINCTCICIRICIRINCIRIRIRIRFRSCVICIDIQYYLILCLTRWWINQTVVAVSPTTVALSSLKITHIWLLVFRGATSIDLTSIRNCNESIRWGCFSGVGWDTHSTPTTKYLQYGDVIILNIFCNKSSDWKWTTSTCKSLQETKLKK